MRAGACGVGQLVNTGASRSSITTGCSQLLVFPFTSTTVQVTVVVPTGNIAGALLLTLATPQLSLATKGGSANVAPQQAGQEVNLRYNLRGVLYLNADVQRPHQTVGTPATTDVYSLDLKLHFEYQ